MKAFYVSYGLLLGALLFPVVSVQAAPLILHLAVDGNDSRTGASSSVLAPDGPLQTLGGIQRQIRTLKEQRSIPKEGVVVMVAPGRYHIDDRVNCYQNDSGTADGPIIIRAQVPGKAIFTGDVELTTTQTVTNRTALDLLRPEALGHVRQIDLSSYFPGEIPGFTGGGIYLSGVQDHPIALFQDDQALPLAQYPQKGYVKTGQCLGEAVGIGDARNFPDGKFRFENDRLAHWAKEPSLWLHGMFSPWVDARLKVAAIDTNDKTIQVVNPKNFIMGFVPDQDFVAFNAISEITRPGDWAVDLAAKTLYVWPKQDPATVPLHLCVSPELFHLHGASHLRFEGLVFEGTRDTAIQLDQCEDVVFQGCTMRHIEGWALRAADVRKVTLIGCDLYDLGEGGASLGGGDRATLTPSQNLVENCHIYDFARFIGMYRPAVDIPWNSVGCTVRHNLIHNTQHAAIIFDGNDHLIEYNIIHDVCQYCSDAGAIYTCARDWSKRGNVVRYNLIHSLRPPDDVTDARRGVYLDDFTSGTTVYGNIITMASAAVQIGGGKDNTMTNNLVLLCPTAVEYSSRGIDSFDAADARKGRQSTIFQATLASPYQTPIYRARYPKIGPEMEGDPIKVHDAINNIISNNIFSCSGDVQIDNAKEVMKTSKVDHNVRIDGDPGLMDPAALDFRLKPDGPGMLELPSFAPLPLEKMGLYPDPNRASPAVRFGPHVTPLPPLLSRLALSRTWRQVPIVPVMGGKVTVDGTNSPGEWDTSLDKAIVCSPSATTASSTIPGMAWSESDGQAVYLLVVVNRDPAGSFIQKGKWGERDGFEIVMQNSHDPLASIGHLHCYPDGTFESVPVAWGDGPWAETLQSQVSYAAKVQNKTWTAELRLPLDAFKIGPGEKIFFNLNIRRSSDQSWTAWVNSPGAFDKSGGNGVLKLPLIQ